MATSFLHRDNDAPQMTQAIDWLIAQGLHLTRPSIYQLKVGPLNFYPVKGTCQFDGNRAERATGFLAFQVLIARIQDAQNASQDDQ